MHPAPCHVGMCSLHRQEADADMEDGAEARSEPKNPNLKLLLTTSHHLII